MIQFHYETIYNIKIANVDLFIYFLELRIMNSIISKLGL